MTMNGDDCAVCFVDTETTSLRPDRWAWDIAIIRREPDGTEDTLFVLVDDVDLSAGDLRSLEVGRFWQRHPRYTCPPAELPPGYQLLHDADAAMQVQHQLRDHAIIVGAVPGFDADTLRAMLARHGMIARWHYQTIDVETVAYGWLTARGVPVPPPWRTSLAGLAELMDVPVERELLHTAYGDAILGMRVWDAMGLTPAPASAAAA